MSLRLFFCPIINFVIALALIVKVKRNQSVTILLLTGIGLACHDVPYISPAFAADCKIHLVSGTGSEVTLACTSMVMIIVLPLMNSM